MEPFESLARSIPYVLLQKNKNDNFIIEALLYGQAGMLAANFEDVYFQSLKREYKFLASKYSLKPIPVVSWKFSRMRPAGFPTIRISQFAQLICKSDRLFSQIIEETDTTIVRNKFRVEASSYWKNHFRFGKLSRAGAKKVGEGFIDQLFINVLCPITFFYGKYISNEEYCERAINHLESIKSEKNNISKKFQCLGLPVNTAADSQALLRLKKVYCDNKQCMSCAIGSALIKGNL